MPRAGSYCYGVHIAGNILLVRKRVGWAQLNHRHAPSSASAAGGFLLARRPAVAGV